ncbi:hypothetical protein CAPTEDRAFT_198693 [Capitella teleta]|uniref:Uncharacterized protein n=1 Tax=Capitella teleta TaxID=283909 RepID=R7V217_CAPTE|nr:hypothetical protein CAPTEDRAFT_198693 [Capitella teleta]|eukprot:ELU12893.1 hypothetical protein CAPTEDRAFT_198693 [Capitella teleta]
MASNDMRGAGPPVNVATASESRLRSVPGIGEARARSLLETRRREPLTQEVLLAMPNFPANFWREKLESEPPEVCCDPEQPDLESTTTEILDTASSHSNTEVKLEPAAEGSTTTGFKEIAQVLTIMEKSMRESQEKILGALMASQERQMASQERQDQQMLELMAVLGQRGVASGGPETLLQSRAAPPLKPLKSTKVDNDTFFQDHFAPEQGTGMKGSDAQLLNTIEKRQNRPLRATLDPPVMNVNRERDVSGGKPATHLGGGWAPHSTTDSHDWRLTQPVRRPPPDVKLLIPTLICNLIMFCCMTVNAILLTDGFSKWCDSIESQFSGQDCSVLETYTWSFNDSNPKIYSFLREAYVACWITLVALGSKIILVSIRLRRYVTSVKRLEKLVGKFPKEAITESMLKTISEESDDSDEDEMPRLTL